MKNVLFISIDWIFRVQQLIRINSLHSKWHVAISQNDNKPIEYKTLSHIHNILSNLPIFNIEIIFYVKQMKHAAMAKRIVSKYEKCFH